MIEQEPDKFKCALLPYAARDNATAKAYELIFEQGGAMGPALSAYEITTLGRQGFRSVSLAYIRLPEHWTVIRTMPQRGHAWDRLDTFTPDLLHGRYKAMIVDDNQRRICEIDYNPMSGIDWLYLADRYDLRVVFDKGLLKVQVMDGIEAIYDPDPVPAKGKDYSDDPEVHVRLRAEARAWAEVNIGSDWRSIKCDTYFTESSDASVTES
jgi:hypothetical protein